jgi:hypothetical protein
MTGIYGCFRTRPYCLTADPQTPLCQVGFYGQKGLHKVKVS